MKITVEQILDFLSGNADPIVMEELRHPDSDASKLLEAVQVTAGNAHRVNTRSVMETVLTAGDPRPADLRAEADVAAHSAQAKRPHPGDVLSSAESLAHRDSETSRLAKVARAGAGAAPAVKGGENALDEENGSTASTQKTAENLPTEDVCAPEVEKRNARQLVEFLLQHGVALPQIAKDARASRDALNDILSGRSDVDETLLRRLEDLYRHRSTKYGPYLKDNEETIRIIQELRDLGLTE